MKEMELGQKIRQRRTLLMLTQEELANRCELTKGYISQLENDKVSPSIETLIHILEVLGTNLSDFFHEDKEELWVYTEDDQYIKDFEGYQQTWLIPTSQEQALEPILVQIQPGATTFKDYPHPGEEFGYVTKGQIKVVYGKEEKYCKHGEAFYFSARQTHYIINDSKEIAEVIWVSTPPNF